MVCWSRCANAEHFSRLGGSQPRQAAVHRYGEGKLGMLFDCVTLSSNHMLQVRCSPWGLSRPSPFAMNTPHTGGLLGLRFKRLTPPHSDARSRPGRRRSRSRSSRCRRRPRPPPPPCRHRCRRRSSPRGRRRRRRRCPARRRLLRAPRAPLLKQVAMYVTEILKMLGVVGGADDVGAEQVRHG